MYENEYVGEPQSAAKSTFDEFTGDIIENFRLASLSCIQ